MILVADDNEYSCHALCRLIKSLGEQCIEAQDGDMAIALLPVAEILITDYVMPRGGIELLARVREVSKIPVILCTGMDPGNFLNTTYDAYLWKPVGREELRIAIEYVRSKYKPRT